jgi:RNA polymerase sigma factor (TIGR02999 family)
VPSPTILASHQITRQHVFVVVTDLTSPDSGDGQLSSEQLLPIVYEELRRLATARMVKESAGHTLQPTALVHEAWLRLSGDGGCSWENRAHFFGAAALAMRRILVDRSRRKAADKRQANIANPSQTVDDLMVAEPGDHILLIHESLSRLEKIDPVAARVVLLKFFSGLASDEIARMLGSSTRSVERQWTVAKAKLYQIIREEIHPEKGFP